MKKFIFSLFTLSLVTFVLTAQDIDNSYLYQRSQGLSLQYGIPYYDFPEGFRYRPILIGGYYRVPFRLKSRRFNIAINAFPHAGFVPVEGQVEVEMGLNAVVEFSYLLGPEAALSFLLGSGPHFISVQTERQRNNYIFSDNFLLEYRRRLGRHEIKIMGGLRHMSNAGFKEPNKGIDDVMVGVSFGTLLD